MKDPTLVHGHSQAFGGVDMTLCGLIATDVRSEFLIFQDGRVDGEVAKITCSTCRARAVWISEPFLSASVRVEATALKEKGAPVRTTERALEFIAAAGITVPPDPGETLTFAVEPGPVVNICTPHVATLPDGSRVNLPAGTTLRAGVSWDGPPADPLRDLCDAFKANPTPALAASISKLREQVDRAASPLLAQARDLLQRARIRLVDEPDAKKLDAEIVAFLAGAAPPEHPVIAALNERLGQMHDALGRATAEGSR